MTVLAAVSGGTGVLALASDSAIVRRNYETGSERSRGVGARPKLHALSGRYPVAAGTFGLTGSAAWGPAVSVDAALTRCRARFDGEDREAPQWAPALEPAYTLSDVTTRVALELFHTLGPLLRDLRRRPWATPDRYWVDGAQTPTVGAFVGGLVVGYCGRRGLPEAWFFLVSGDRVESVVMKFRGGPGRYGVAISPGADAAAAAYRGIVTTVPRSLEAAAAMAGAIVQAQIDAPPAPPGVFAGPVQCLGLVPGAPPRVLAPAA